MNIALTIIDENQRIANVKLLIESSKSNIGSSNSMFLHKSNNEPLASILTTPIKNAPNSV